MKPYDYGIPEIASDGAAKLSFAPVAESKVNADRVLLRRRWLSRAEGAKQVAPHLGQLGTDELILAPQPFGTQLEVPVPELGVDVGQAGRRCSRLDRRVRAGRGAWEQVSFHRTRENDHVDRRAGHRVPQLRSWVQFRDQTGGVAKRSRPGRLRR